ncbi:MAG: 23S rRNA (guanosine(2251)-2'-O)-methyltransferase RlmB [Ruminococcaceae bacterium]|nr:23S rRNA (guanosine(2251)-2'-O)-methyltransferase RlmB [Oscillospiraceae bacterium]
MKNETYKKTPRDAVPSEGAVVAGRNAVLELLSSGRAIEKIYLQKDGEGSLKKIVAIAKEKKIPLSYADKQKLTALAGGSFHQGAVALAQQKEYATLDQLFEIAEDRGEAPFFVIADGVEDPHNLGALIRCCEGAGAHGIIIPKNKAVGITPTVIKSSAGAAEHLAVCRVTNLAAAIDKLRERNVWVYACEADGVPYDKQDFSGAIAIVLGSEGFGISRLIKEKSDFIISLPMRGKVNSLNVSCAGAVILYEAAKYR